MITKAVSFQKEKSLAVVQFLTSDQNTFNYISGANAMKQDMIEVKEVSEAGSVNNLIVMNTSGSYVFFMDGDVLEGAKQNRVLNTSVLLAPQSKTVLPVSCVEGGRWRQTSQKFRDADVVVPSTLRAKKARSVKYSLSAVGKYSADQSEVWDEVRVFSKAHKVHSETSNLTDVYDAKQGEFEEFIKKIELNKEANGIAVFINNKLLNIDLFNRTDIYAEYFPKIVKSAALESFGLEVKEKELTEAEAKFKTVSFLDKFEEMEFETHSGVALGEEKRFESDELTGFELNYNKHLIHLTALNVSNN